MPAEEWSHKVGGAKDIEAAGEDATCNAVKGREIPGYLRAVDGQMGGVWAEATLGDEEFVGVCGGDL